ncbi:MAG: hypothetical protein CME64_14000 [Halobacteriovoraceae bacterium]|nr:hypothetical protein [Halobacteriovoraceae bacterium]
MKKVIEYFVNNSVVVNLLTLLIVVMGSLSLFSLNKETFPNVDFNFIVISTTYPGAAAEDVEKLLTLDIERELKEVDGIEELNALSAEGASIVSLKIDPDYDVDEVLVEVKDAMDKLGDLPDDVEAPVITRLTNRTRGIMNVAIYGDNEWNLRAKAKSLRDTLERDSRVSRAEMTGYRDEIFYVEADLKELKKYEMNLGELSQAIGDRQVNVSAGNIKDPTQEKLVRTLVENETVSSIENIIVRSTEFGQVVKVKDVAKVSRTLKDAQREDRSQGKLAIFLDIAIKSSADVLESAEFIKNTLEEETKKLGVEYKIYNDFSFYVKRRLGVLTQNGLQGIILVVICLMFFLNAKVSIITALGAPFAFFFAFSLMEGFGITINLISMFGLIMVLGMLVDDSIIVAEQYYQKLEQGMAPKKAAQEAAWETLGPVTATIITTMVAFGSLFYMEGIMGKFLWPIPAVVIIALAASWIECFFILPGHLADFAGHDKNVEKTKWYLPLLHAYEKVLNAALRFNKSTLFVFTALFAISVYTATTMRFELFPSDDVTRAQINIKGPVGTPFEVTRDQLLKIEKSLFETIRAEELVGVQTITGYQMFKGGRSKSGSHYGSISLELTMETERDRGTNEILAKVAESARPLVDSKFQFSVEKNKPGPPTGKPINVELYGDDLEELEKLAEEVKRDLLDFDGVLSAEIDYETGKPQIIARINEKEARRLRVSNRQIAMELRRAFEGATVTTLKKSDEDVDVVVRLKEEQRSDENILNSLEVKNEQGRTIKISQVVDFVEESGAYIIRRLDRKRTIAISGEVDLGKTTSREINQKLRPYLEKKVEGMPGTSFALSGENKDTQESLESFKKALAASMIIIFIIIFIQFKSLALPAIIMSAIPFGLIGVVASFKVYSLPIGFMALMGMLGLVGVVINDSIVLVTFIARTLKVEGWSLESVIKATKSRFRPVILTTFTTVVGLLPVAHMPGGDPFLKPMATSFAYGLLFASGITLLFIPALYKTLLDVMAKFNKAPDLE